MPTDTHDFQLEAIGHLLDGDDVLLVTATVTASGVPFDPPTYAYLTTEYEPMIWLGSSSGKRHVNRW